MKIYIGADHNGYALKEKLEDYLQQAGYEVIDKGDESLRASDDFPVYAARVAGAILTEGDKDVRGILICGSGQGMVMAANRFKGIRASLVWNISEARSSRNDDDSNVLCLPAHELSDFAVVKDIADTWLKTPFAAAARFVRRVNQLDELN